MTEMGWLTSIDPQSMLHFLSGKASDRKSVKEYVSSCLVDKDLARTHSEAPRDGWTAAETKEWDAYWSDVRALRSKVIESSVPSKP